MSKQDWTILIGVLFVVVLWMLVTVWGWLVHLFGG